MNYLITFDSFAVISVIPVAPDAEVLGISEKLITTIDNAKVMLAAAGIDTTLLENYIQQNPEG